MSDFQKKEESGKNMVCRGKKYKKIKTEKNTRNIVLQGKG